MSADSDGMQNLPPWLREVDGNLATVPQFILAGNVRDRQVLERGDGTSYMAGGVVEVLWSRLEARGYEFLLVFDPVDGFRLLPDGDAHAGAVEAARAVLGDDLQEGRPASLEALRGHLRPITDSDDHRCAIAVDYGSRLLSNPDGLTPPERSLFLVAEKLSQTARPHGTDGPVPLFNSIFWIVNQQRDLPGLLYSGNDGIRTIPIPRPDLSERTAAAEILGGRFADFRDSDDDRKEAMAEEFAGQTDGLTVNAMRAISSLALSQAMTMAEINDAARAFRVGVADNPWNDPEVRKRIKGGEARISKVVAGQDHAIKKALDILIRSASGLTGAHASPNAVRPRGVLFFAGPTGVGKTELAKQITKLVFGDTQSYIRFDMSEFSQEENVARLIGAPPGYVGFDAGGELTNAVRERPFCLILFDEIEKAHGRILDKFLQVLEDGRLTDGAGETVYFSEAIIVFTSNLGIYQLEPGEREGLWTRTPNVTREENSLDEIERIVTAGISDHFINSLGRPELLNRLGDNIVVFDFIREEAAERIFEILLNNVVARVAREHDRTLDLAPEAMSQLRSIALSPHSLDNGGRGIGSALENALVNPLSRVLFELPPEPGSTLRVTDLRSVGSRFELVLE